MVPVTSILVTVRVVVIWWLNVASLLVLTAMLSSTVAVHPSDALLVRGGACPSGSYA